MAESKLIAGTLAVTGKKAVRLKFTNPGGKQVEIAAPPDQLSSELAELSRADVTKLDGCQVEFELAGPNRAERIREAGKPWTPPAAGRAVGDDRRRGGRPAGQRPQHRPGQGGRPSERPPVGPPPRPRVEQGFHHAYNFVPAPPRRPDAPEPMRDGLPVGHHSYQEDHFSGWIEVALRTVTPLLIPDASQAVEVPDTGGHRSFPLRTGPDGRPYLPPTSVKGMLRTAFEAVTNSRLGVFAGHDAPLAYRMPARDGLRLVPAVVEDGQIKLLRGSLARDSSSRPPVPAAWLHKYAREAPSWGGLDQHGTRVWAYVTLWQHRHFQFWNVAALRPHGSTPPTDTPADRRRPGRNSRQVQPVEGMWVAGYVCITGKNIDPKHDERVFFTVDPRPPLIPVENEHRRSWKHLITNYQEIHEEERRKKQKGPPALKHSEWSRHVVGDRSEREFGNGTLCYVDVDESGPSPVVRQVYPVNISRKLFESSPEELLRGTELLPAGNLKELSPAERVFGWVHQKGRGAFRGNLRIGAIACESPAEQAIEEFGQPGVPLAILGAAKPQQARFYVARAPEGDAQPDGLPLDQAAYAPGKGLRGIKVYPHHHGPPDQNPQAYWGQPLEDRTGRLQDGWSQEYRRPTPPENGGTQVRDDQNRSIQAWVRPGTTFSFKIHVQNLSRFELGALLWLLSLEPQQYHRLGGGKPLGFGSVQLSVRGADLRDGAAWREYYRSLLEESPATGTRITLDPDDPGPGRQAIEPLIGEYQQTVAKACGADFRQVPFIAAFLRAAAGYADQKPVHYPRVRQTNGSTAPDPAGENFQWFGENERQHRLALPELAGEQLLPYYEIEERRRT